MLSSGGLGNLNAFPVWIKWLTYISPQRYACAGFYRVMSRHIPEPYYSTYLKVIGYDELGDGQCIGVIIGMFGFWSVGGWLIMCYRHKSW